MRNIRYIGTKPTSNAFYDETGIVWTPGKVDTVLDDEVALRMLMHPDVFEDAGDVHVESIVISTDAPSGADGRPDGTIYFQVI